MRRLSDSDISAVREIDRLSFTVHEQYEAEFYERLVASESYDALVATGPDGNVVGWVLADLTRRPIRIKSVSVHPAFRRTGYGRRLLTTILSRHAADADLLVERDNHAALALYCVLGFSRAEADPEMPERLRMVWHVSGCGPNSPST